MPLHTKLPDDLKEVDVIVSNMANLYLPNQSQVLMY